MHIRQAEYVKSGTKPEHYPSAELPEIAFAGRSNVGKSSLMNTLMQRRALVKVSNTPGRTQLLSWFRVNQSLWLCDLPGYGFAKVPVSVRGAWGKMVNTYLAKRDNLLALVLITDVRRGYEDDDRMLMDAAGQLGLHVILTCTKCDKLSRNQLRTRQEAIGREMQVDPMRDIIWFSSLDRRGQEQLWRRIESLLPIEPAVAPEQDPDDDFPEADPIDGYVHVLGEPEDEEPV